MKVDVGEELPCGCRYQTTDGRRGAEIEFCSPEHARRLWFNWDSVVLGSTKPAWPGQWGQGNGDSGG